jgi:hypothetical protein
MLAPQHGSSQYGSIAAFQRRIEIDSNARHDIRHPPRIQREAGSFIFSHLVAYPFLSGTPTAFTLLSMN